MKNIMLVIEYDGTNYHGWQYQKNAITVQEVVEKAIEKVTGEKVKLIGSSRTDTGV
ncbi:MAG: tRNA pseudouridine(38-40) synthase TruA, partial [Caldanaerobacter sp.]